MKIKNLRYSLKAISLALTLSLTGCGNQNSEIEELRNSFIESQETIEFLQNEVEVLNEKLSQHIEEETKALTDDEIREIAREIELNSILYVNYLKDEKRLILKDRFGIEDAYISNSVIDKINLLLKQPSIKKLVIEHVDFNFVDLDITNIEEIEFFNISLDNSKELMSVANKNNINVGYIMYDTDSSLELINFISDNHIACSSLAFTTNSNEIVKYCSLFEKVNSDSIFMFVTDDEKLIVDINAKLHDNTSVFSVDLGYMNSERETALRELGNINIESSNSELCIKLTGITVTENTKFLVNNNSSHVFLYGDHTDVNPFYDLENVYLVNYYNSTTSTDVNFRDNGVSTYDEAISELEGKKLVK